MSVASEKQLRPGLDMGTSQGISVSTTTAAYRTYVLMSLVAVAVVLRLYGIGLFPLEGDEYGSIVEAKSVGLNWNSIIYSTLMHFWIRLGASEFWLRLPAALFGVATVPLLFKIGEKLGGWRTAVVAGVLAATSPFNIYHSQEVRFYSLFMFAAAAFMLATINYVDSRTSIRNRSFLMLTGTLLLVSHFVGLIGLYAQGAAAFLSAKKRRASLVLMLMAGLPVLIFGLPILPPVHKLLLHLYQLYGNAFGADLSTTAVSLISFAKIMFAGYIFTLGYHIYPLRLVIVIPAVCVTGLLLLRGTRRLWKERKWQFLPITYLVTLVGIYLVLDSIGGRVASGVSPRHAAFVWPAFILLLALGLTSFTKTNFQILLVAVLAINSLALWFGWQKDWTYGPETDYRAAGVYVRDWASKDSAMILDGRSYDAAQYYFPTNIPFASMPARAGVDQSSYRRLIVVTNDWRPEVRLNCSEFLSSLTDKFTIIDGRVDYPLFEYVFERKPSSANTGLVVADNGQLALPPSLYPIEFQDLKLPVTTTVGAVPLKVIGAFTIPDYQDRKLLPLPLVPPTAAHRVVLLTNFAGSDHLSPSEQVAELIVEDKTGATTRFPVRLNHETALWSQRCAPAAECQTVFQWHKRIAIAGQNSFPDAWRDFSAGMHGVVLNLPASTVVAKISVRYLAESGHLYVWSIALVS